MIRTVCVPELSLFELETFGLDNVAGPLQNSHGVYELEAFVGAAPFSCQLKHGLLQVDVKNVQGASERCAIPSAVLSIRMNGNEIDTVDRTHGGCSGAKNPRHQIRATQYQLTHCRTDFDDLEQTIPAPGPATLEPICKTVPFP